MARKLSSFDWSTHSGGPNHRYPWDEWLDGSTVEVVEGEDIRSIAGFRATLAHQANKRGLDYKTTSYDTVDGKRRLAFVVRKRI